MNIKTWADRTPSMSECLTIEATMQAEIDALRAELAALKAQADNPEFDGIENANPAWWRGHWHSAEVFCRKVNEILDGKDDGKGVSNPPWEPTRRRLLALKAQPVQEPFCMHWVDRWGCNHYADKKEPHPENATPLYLAAPVQPAPLTFGEIESCFPEGSYTTEEGFINVSAQWLHDFARAIEAAVRTGGAG